MPSFPDLCPNDVLATTVQAFGADQTESLTAVEQLLRQHPGDTRLQFLKGSLLAGLERYGEARSVLDGVVQRAPDYAVARFQLGFLELTMGDAARARETWRPLRYLAQDDPLRLFASGLEHLVEDRFAEAIALLQQGIKANTEILPLNADMGLIIDKTRTLMAHPVSSAPAQETVSATQLLLQRYGAKSPTKH